MKSRIFILAMDLWRYNPATSGSAYLSVEESTLLSTYAKVKNVITHHDRKHETGWDQGIRVLWRGGKR